MWYPKLLLCFICLCSQFAAAELPDASPARLPRWRGFNLLEKFDRDFPERNAPFQEADFKWISEFGFNFVRLPLDYRIWIKNGDWEQIDETAFQAIDQAVEWGGKYSIHVCLNFHRAPGFTVNKPAEAKDLWKDAAAQKVCAKHWAFFARRYKGISNRKLSFNLFNEPHDISADAYTKVVAIMATAIRSQDHDRLIIADGLNWGNNPVPELKKLRVAEATRGYTPSSVTHYHASWVAGADRWPKPTQWPPSSTSPNHKDAALAASLNPWKKLKHQGVGVMIGEWGAHNETPHDVVLSWMEDCLGNYREAGCGWALWNFRGSFGVMDSYRKDVQYEDFHGHKLDRAMLKLLQKD